MQTVLVGKPERGDLGHPFVGGSIILDWIFKK